RRGLLGALFAAIRHRSSAKCRTHFVPGSGGKPVEADILRATRRVFPNGISTHQETSWSNHLCGVSVRYESPAVLSSSGLPRNRDFPGIERWHQLFSSLLRYRSQSEERTGIRIAREHLAL